MFDSSMSAAAIAQRVQELQAAAGIKAQLVSSFLSPSALHEFYLARTSISPFARVPFCVYMHFENKSGMLMLDCGFLFRQFCIQSAGLLPDRFRGGCLKLTALLHPGESGGQGSRHNHADWLGCTGRPRVTGCRGRGVDRVRVPQVCRPR